MLASLRSFIGNGEPRLSDIANLPDLDYVNPSDAVFKALAIVPMTGLAPSQSPLEGFPVDLKEFAHLVSGDRREHPR
ncbi:MAG: hypothetical protein WBL50_04985 [Candidatus Acidiferrum sp.]